MNEMERLNAYLDKQLSADEMLVFEDELEINPALAKQLEALRDVDEALRAPFDARINETIPDRFLHLLQEPQAEQADARIFDFADARARRDAALSTPSRKLWSTWPARAAIAATFVAGVFAVAQLQPNQSQSKAVEIALNQTPSGTVVTLAPGQRLTPRLSFVAKDGRYCREFDLVDETHIACRSKSGWTIEAKVKAAPKSDSENFATAGGGSEALDAVYDQLGAGDPLDAASERALIARNWK